MTTAASIPFCDLRRSIEPIRREIDAALADVIDSGWFLRGPQVSAFEAEWAAYCGQSYCVTCNSGTDALTLAAMAAGLSDVDVQANTLSLTAIGLKRAGCRVRVGEVDGSGRLAEITANAVPVLLYGRLPTDAEAEATLFDAAHAHGWRPPPHAIACWSFYPTKTLGGLGDGGAVTTNDEHLAAKMRALSGRDDNFYDDRQITSRIDEMQAAVLRVKLRYLDDWLAARREIAGLYWRHLPGKVAKVSQASTDLHHLFVIRSDRRDELAQHLHENGVMTKVHFPLPLHSHNASWANSLQKHPKADEWCETVLSLPCYPGLSDAEVRRICEVVGNFTTRLNGPPHTKPCG